jgi:hypothetical protein
MNAKLDINSALGGLALGVLLTVAVGASTGQSNHSCGRFEIAGANAQFVIIDTTTGQGWLGDFHDSLNLPSHDALFFQPKLFPANSD